MIYTTQRIQTVMVYAVKQDSDTFTKFVTTRGQYFPDIDKIWMYTYLGLLTQKHWCTPQ